MESNTTNKIISQVSQTAVDALITPSLIKLAKKVKIGYNNLLVPRGQHFKKYLDNEYKGFSFINTLVAQDRIKSLKEVYLPMTLIEENQVSKDGGEVIVNGMPPELFENCKKLLIIDTAGMGKSTMLKRMFIDICDQGLDILGIPLFINLRRLKKNWSIIDELEHQLSSLSERFDKELLLFFLQSGGFVFFLDGFDEISLNDKNVVTQNLQDFINKAGDNSFIITSRPDSSLGGFLGFKTYTIKPLEKEEAYSLIRKYDLSSNKNVSQKLIDLLKSKEYKSASEFLQNPLLTTLLFNAFNYKQIIPLKKHLFYRQVYDAYFEDHDLKKGDSYIHEKYSCLDIDDFARVLKYIGFHSMKEGIEFSKDEILVIISKAKKKFSYLDDFKSSDYLRDLVTVVPLFCEEGVGYKWAHKSLMEYFAARYIADELTDKNKDKVLTAIYKKSDIYQFINVLDIYHDIDYRGFSKNITLPICESFLDFRKDQMNKVDNNALQPINQTHIEERIGILFMGQIAYFQTTGFFSYYDAKDKFERIMGENVSLLDWYLRQGKRVFFAQKYESYFPLVRLLSLKRKDLICTMKNNQAGLYGLFTSIDSEISDNSINEVYYINLMNGNDSVWSYASINRVLGNLISMSYFSYHSCETEVSRIKKEITDDFESWDVLDGI